MNQSLIVSVKLGQFNRSKVDVPKSIRDLAQADAAPDPQDVVDVAKWVLSFGCCRVITGNVDDDPDDQIDISDLVYLVDYMFNGGPQPACVDEANIDGNGSGLSGIDISDLVYLVDYMFNGGPTPPSCP